MVLQESCKYRFKFCGFSTDWLSIKVRLKKEEYLDVQGPNIIQLYDKNMGRVDLAYCLILLYRINIKSKKYYYMIDMSIVNFWLVYKKNVEKINIPEKKISLLAMFKFRMAVFLMKVARFFFVLNVEVTVH